MMRFVALEGIDGSGKTTQITRIAERLEAIGKHTLIVHEPGGTEAGERIRQLLKHDTISLDPMAELLLFAAARAQLVQEVIKPAIEAGTIVLCDRFTASTVAYQGYGRGISLSGIYRTNELATGGLYPQLTILVDVPVDEAFKRKEVSNVYDRFESEARDFTERVYRGYHAQLQGAYNFEAVDGTKSIEEVTEAIWRKLGERFEL